MCDYNLIPNTEQYAAIDKFLVLCHMQMLSNFILWSVYWFVFSTWESKNMIFITYHGVCSYSWISYYIPFAGLYFPPVKEFYWKMSHFNTKFNFVVFVLFCFFFFFVVFFFFFAIFFIQIVAMATNKRKQYQSLHTEQVLEEIILHSNP